MFSFVTGLHRGGTHDLVKELKIKTNHMKVIESVWFSTPAIGASGIVCAENDQGEKKFYMGVGKGLSERIDEQSIVDWGAKLDPEYVKNFFDKHLK